MKTEHFNGLTEAQQERISLLLEEASEVVHVCGKILRHGFDSYNPDDPELKTNRHLLSKELGDLSAASRLMTDSKDILKEHIEVYEILKLENVKKYLHHN